MIFELNIKTGIEGGNVYNLMARCVGTDLVRRLRDDLLMPDLNIYKIEEEVEGGAVNSYQIVIEETFACRCSLFRDSNKCEIFIEDSALNQFVGIGYEISNNDTTVLVRPDFQTLRVKHGFFSEDSGFACAEIKNVKFRYFLHEERFLDEWERMGFPTVFHIQEKVN